MRLKRLTAVLITVACTAFIAACGADKDNKNQEENKDAANVEIEDRESLSEIIEKTKEVQKPDLTRIVYASKDRVIILGNISLLVYDLNEEKITGGIAVDSIGMNLSGEDANTVCRVNKEGSKVLLFNEIFDLCQDKVGETREFNRDYYLYNPKEDKLYKTDIKRLDDEYKGIRYEEVVTSYSEYLDKYPDLIEIDHKFMDEKNICFFLVEKGKESNNGLKLIKFLVVNTAEKSEKLYSIDL